MFTFLFKAFTTSVMISKHVNFIGFKMYIRGTMYSTAGVIMKGFISEVY